ncbi:MAG: YciI family protein [Propionicimonas sp.]|nr:YciI family protein [Propionicimonas sp.]
MAHWIYFIHPPRADFVATITPDEAAVMAGAHSDYLGSLLESGRLLLAGPTTGGALDDGIAIFEAEDEDDARRVMAADPAVTAGLMTGELRRIRLGFVRGGLG